MLILLWNRMFGQKPELGHLHIPAGVEFTEDRRRIDLADAVVFHIPSLERLFLTRKRPRQLWVAWSMECAAHYRRLRTAWFMRRFDLSMTYRQSADVMTSYIPTVFLRQTLPPVQAGSHQHLLCSFISGTHDRSGRNRYLDQLGRHLEVHRYGRQGDRVIADDQGHASKLRIAGRYKFTLAFENAVADDYVTEKLYDPLLAGSVPVYLGAANVGRFAPTEGCYIDVADFSGPADLADYLRRLDQDAQALAYYLDWRSRPLSPHFKALCERNRRPAFERLCQALLAHAAAGGRRPRGT